MTRTRLVFVLFGCSLVLATCSKDRWGVEPVHCSLPFVRIGSIEGYVIDVDKRSVSFRQVPNVWLGSDVEVIERAHVVDHQLGVSNLEIAERPREMQVRLTYDLPSVDGGATHVDDLLRCVRLP